MKDKNLILKIIRWLLLILLVAIIILVVLAFKNKDISYTPEQIIPIEVNEVVHLVDNHSTFTSIESAINKLLLYARSRQ